MNPLSIRLRNCGSWREVTLDLPEGITALTGANGAGKSTLVNAIEIALFGPEGRSLADLYPRGGGANEELQIELVFEHGGNTYRVRRSYSPKGRGTSKTDLDQRRTDHAFTRHSQGMNFCVCGLTIAEHDWNPLTVESQRSTQEMLEGVIGINRETFRASSFVKQTEVGRFCDAPPRTRKAILADALGLQEWDGWLERSRQDKRRLETELAHVAGTLDRAEQELAERAGIELLRAQADENVKTYEMALSEASTAALSARDALAEATRRAESRVALIEAQRRAQSLLEALGRDIWRREEEIAALDTRLAQRDTYAREAAGLEGAKEELAALRLWVSGWQESQTLIGEMRRLEDEVARANVKAADLEAKATAVLAELGQHVCDRCGQTLQHEAAERAAASYRSEAISMLEVIAANSSRIGAIASDLRALPVEAPDYERLAHLEGAIDGMQQAESRLAALDEAQRRRAAAAEELEQMRAGLPEREEAVAAAGESLAALGPHDPQEQERLAHAAATARTAEQKHRADLDQATGALARYDERLERLDRIATETAEALRRRDTLNDDLALTQAMEKACGANGVPALIMETLAIPQLETEATRILGLLGGPAYAAELRTQRETKTSGIAETLDVVLLTDAGEATYENFSGGERARIAFALRLALAQLLAARRGTATGILVIDEIEGLDGGGIAALVSVLEGLAASVPRIVVLSHQPELRDAFERSIALERVDGHSRIAA